MKFGKKAIALIMATVFATAGLSGCQGEKTSGEAETKKLTFWTTLPSAIQTKVKNYGETPFYQEVMKKTGVDIEFVHPSAAGSSEQFNVMLASKDYPDMIENDWSSYPGGEAKACEDGILTDLTDYIDEYAPNFKRFLEEECPDAEKWVTTDGRYYVIPSLSSDKDYTNQVGLWIRKDYLDKYGLSVPTTIDELEKCLTVFKENGVKYPFFDQRTNPFGYYCIPGSAFDATSNVIVKDNEVQNPYFNTGMREFMETMTRWYKNGLVDPEMYSMDWNSFDSKIAEGSLGTLITDLKQIETRTEIIKKSVPKAEFVAVPFLSKNKNENPNMIYYSRLNGYTFANAVGISSNCKDVGAALKFLDYAYSDEGHRLYNFGVEGVSYEMKDGKPVFTDTILANKDGLTKEEALTMYTRAEAAGYVETSYYDQLYTQQYQKDAAKLWSDQFKAAATPPEFFWRACYKLTAEESDEISNYQLGYSSYATEMAVKFATGVESMENYDAFLNDLISKGAKDCLMVYNQAFDRLKFD